MSNNISIKGSFKKIYSTIIIQIIIILVSVVTSFLLPRYLGAEEFGYWSIYLFYIAYVNLFGFGYNDGLSLHYSGRQLDDLPLKKIRVSNRIMLFYSFVVMLLLLAIGQLLNNFGLGAVYPYIIINIPLAIIQSIMVSMQISIMNTKAYNISALLYKVPFTIMVLFLIFNNNVSFEIVIVADLIVRLLVVTYLLKKSSKFLWGSSLTIKDGLCEIREKSVSGFKITISYITSSIMPISGRYILEKNASIIEYGQYSFAMSLITIILIFTSTAGIVIFPVLKSLNKNKLIKIYPDIKLALELISLLSLILFYPLKFIIFRLLPAYVPVLSYLPLLLAVSFPLVMSQIIITPYYKVFRKETQLLKLNILGLTSILTCNFLVYTNFQTPTSVAITTFIGMYMWYISAVFLLNRYMKVEKENGLYVNISILFIFILTSTYMSAMTSLFIYTAYMMLYMCSNRYKIKKIIMFVLFRDER